MLCYLLSYLSHYDVSPSESFRNFPTLTPTPGFRLWLRLSVRKFSDSRLWLLKFSDSRLLKFSDSRLRLSTLSENFPTPDSDSQLFSDSRLRLLMLKESESVKKESESVKMSDSRLFSKNFPTPDSDSDSLNFPTPDSLNFPTPTLDSFRKFSDSRLWTIFRLPTPYVKRVGVGKKKNRSR